MDIATGSDSRSAPDMLPCEFRDPEQRPAASVWTVTSGDEPIDWSRFIVKDAVFLSCMNQYGLISHTFIESSFRENNNSPASIFSTCISKENT